MNDRVPPHDDPVSERETPRVNKVNHLSHKTYLKRTSRLWGLGLFGLASAASLGWIWRMDLAESGVQSLLRDRGIEGGISVTNLSVNSATIRDLRLGPAGNPTLMLPSATLRWHVDITTGRLVIDRLDAQGALLHIGRTKTGELDFGALKPFLIPSDKPSQVRLADVNLSNAQVSFDTPSGRGSARIEARGGDLTGWRAKLLVQPPLGVATQSSDQPLAIGLAILPAHRTGTGGANPTQIGIAIRPNGQSYRFGDLFLDRMVGQAQGLVVLDGNGGTHVTPGTIALEMKRVRLGLDRLAATDVSLQGGAGQWQHHVVGQRLWTETGFGTWIGQVSAKSVKMPQASLQDTRIDLSAARTEAGVTRFDVKGSGTGLSTSPSLGWRADKVTIDGFAQSNLKDLRQVSQANWQGQTRLAWTNLLGPNSQSNDPLSGQTGLDFAYAHDQRQAQIRLADPLELSFKSGVNFRFRPDPKRPPAMQLDLKNAQPALRDISGAGDLAIQARNGGKGQGRIELARWTPQAWSIDARNFQLSSVPLPGNLAGLFMSGQIGAIQLAAEQGKVPKGSGRGTLEVSAKAGAAGLGLGAGRARLSGTIQGNGQTLLVSAAGPVEGFGYQASGVRQARISLDAKASRSQSDWVMDLDSKVTAQSFRSPELQVLDLSGRLKGRARIKGPEAFSKANPTPILQSMVRLRNWDTDFSVTGFVGHVSSQNIGLHRGTISMPIRARGDGQSIEASGTLSLDAQILTYDESHLDGLRADLPLRFRSGFGPAPAWQATTQIQAIATSFTSGETSVENLAVEGPALLLPSEDGQGILVRGDTCLQLTAEGGRFPGDARIGPVTSSLCPDRQGRFASLSAADTILYADARFEPLELQLGAVEDGRSVRLGAVRGDFRPSATGGWQLDLTSKELGYNFKLPDGGFAEIKAQDSSLRLTPASGGMTLRGQLAGLRAKGLPVEISGTATTDLQARPAGLVGSLAFENLLVRDVPSYFPTPDENGEKIQRPPRFGMLSLSGEGTINGSQIDIQSDISLAESGAFLARAILNHNAATGLGRLDALSEAISFGEIPRNAAGIPQEGRRPLDADDLVPALQGVILDVVGDVSGSASMAWGPNQPTVSDARLSTANLDFLTMLGQVSNLTGTFSLDDLLKIRTAGEQGFTIAQFDPGLPIEDVNVVFALPGNNTLELKDASWPFADGKLSVRPASWTFRDGDQSFAVDVEGVDLAKFLGLTKIPNLQIDGKVSGVFPVEVRNGSVEIVGGRLQAREGGGKIRYIGPVPGGNGTPKPDKRPWYQRWFAPKPPSQAEITAQALTGIEYEIDVITVDGRITGDLTLGVVLIGANPQVLSGVPIKLNVKATLPVGQLTDMANRFLETATSADMLKELDKLDRSQNGKGFIPTEQEDRAAQAQKSRP